MNAIADCVFLFDVDNTLLDNDRVHDDLDAHIAAVFGRQAAARYWAIYEDLRKELGYADYLGAIQRFRLECGDELRVQDLAAFLLEYPFAERLYPHALDAIAHLAQSGPTVILSDGDVVLQPRKICVSGLADAFEGRVLIYVHKQAMLDDVARRFPAAHYVMFDDKPRVLDAMKQVWCERLTAVFVRQGHYACDPQQLAARASADLELACIGDAVGLAVDAFKSTHRMAATATE